MYKSDMLAYSLLRKRYGNNIIYRRRKSPKFICPDGKKYEPKILYGPTIRMTKRQYIKLKESKNTYILVFRPDGKLVLEESAEKLRCTDFCGIPVTIIGDEEREEITVLKIVCSKSTAEKFKRHAKKWKNEEEFLKYLIELWEKRENEPIPV